MAHVGLLSAIFVDSTTSEKNAPQMRRSSKHNPKNRSADGWTVAIGEYDRTTGRDADHGYHQRSGKPDHHDLEVGGAVCGVHRPVHDVLRASCTLVTPSRQKVHPAFRPSNVGASRE